MKKYKYENKDLAYCLAVWLRGHKCTVQIVSIPKTDVFEVHYTLRDDIKPQPPVRINGSITFPKGSQHEVVSAFLREGRI